MTTFTFELVSNLKDIERHMEAWKLLSLRSEEDNVFFTPDYLIPNLKLASNGGSYILLFIYHKNTSSMAAFCAFSLKNATFTKPFKSLSYFHNNFSFSSNPLIYSSDSRRVRASLISFLCQSGHPWKMLYLREGFRVNSFGRSQASLSEKGIHYIIKQSKSRALLDKQNSYDQFLENISKSQRKNFSRCLRRLEKRGDVKFKFYRHTDQPDLVIDNFLKIERSGWKGERGSAIDCDEGTRQFFTCMIKSFNDNKKLFNVELWLDDILIGMSVSLVHGKTLFAFKIAYNPEFRSFSPGLLTMVEATRQFFLAEDLNYADGCNEPESFISDYWGENQVVNKLCVPTNHLLSKLHFSLQSLYYSACNKKTFTVKKLSRTMTQ